MKKRADVSSPLSAPRARVEMVARQSDGVEQLQERVRSVEAAAIGAARHQGTCRNKPVPALDSLLGGFGSGSSAGAR